VAESSVGDRAAERLGDRILAAQLSEGGGAVAAVDRELFCHASPYTLAVLRLRSATRTRTRDSIAECRRPSGPLRPPRSA